MSTNLPDHSDNGMPARTAYLAPRLRPVGPRQPTMHTATWGRWARAAARELGAIAELMLMVWIGVVVALVSYVIVVFMSAVFDLEIVDYGKEG